VDNQHEVRAMIRKYIMALAFLSLILAGMTSGGWLIFRSIFFFADWSMKNITDMDQLILSLVTVVVLLPILLLLNLDRFRGKSFLREKR